MTPIHFRVPSLIFGPLVAKYLAENGVSGTFWRNYWSNSLNSWHLPLWGESLDPYTFSCSKPHFRPPGGQIFGRKWGFRNFLKKLLAQFISCLAFILMEWVSWPIYIFVFLATFSALWWPNIWLEMGFPEFIEKTIGSINYIPGIYPQGDIWMRIFLDEVGRDQSWGILSPFMGTACFSDICIKIQFCY